MRRVVGMLADTGRPMIERYTALGPRCLWNALADDRAGATGRNVRIETHAKMPRQTLSISADTPRS